MPGAVEEFVVELASNVHAAAAARQAVTDRGPDLDEPLRGDVLLLVTELVTNAVRHGPVVGNGAALTLAPHTTNGNPPSGWGLVLVERIAEQWGVLAEPPGTCVWFEVAA
jgi:hypothetical protein